MGYIPPPRYGVIITPYGGIPRYESRHQTKKKAEKAADVLRKKKAPKSKKATGAKSNSGELHTRTINVAFISRQDMSAGSALAVKDDGI